jgi:hypothetical protein
VNGQATKPDFIQLAIVSVTHSPYRKAVDVFETEMGGRGCWKIGKAPRNNDCKAESPTSC